MPNRISALIRWIFHYLNISPATNSVPEIDLIATVKDLRTGLANLGFEDSKFRESNLIRLNVLRDHIKNNRLNNNLECQA